MTRSLTFIPFARQFEILELDQSRIVRKDELTITIFARLNIQVIYVIRCLVFEDESVEELSFSFLSRVRCTKI